jgi:hypothetical protein
LSRTACRIARPVGASGAITACSSRTPRSRTGSRPGGRKAARRTDTDYLDWALSDFSGFIAADELDDGPFCILSIVDNRTFKRLAYQVLSHDPTHKDIEAFFGRFRTALDARGLSVEGITTDGSSLYPEPIATVFGDVPHQVCTFHVLRDRITEVLSAVAQVRKGDLFEHRHLFVRRHLTPAQRATLGRITRGLPRLRALRGLMEEVYRLFDRRCRTTTALARLAALRARLRRFVRLRAVLKKLFASGLEKALVFLDEELLGATSNAVERGNRRYRKMQKTVYRVRTRRGIEGRLALDLLRERQARNRTVTTKTLHKARAA